MKFISLSLFVCFLSLNTYAAGLSVYGGGNLTSGEANSNANDESVSLSSKLGFQLGAHLSTAIDDKLLFRYGLAVRQIGMDRNEIDDSSGLEVNYKIQNIYARLPLSVEYIFEKNLSFLLNASLNVLLDDDFDVAINGTPISDSILDTDFKSVFLDLGAGAAVNVNECFSIEASFAFSVTPVLDDSTGVGDFELDVDSFYVNFIYKI